MRKFTANQDIKEIRADGKAIAKNLKKGQVFEVEDKFGPLVGSKKYVSVIKAGQSEEVVDDEGNDAENGEEKKKGKK